MLQIAKNSDDMEVALALVSHKIKSTNIYVSQLAHGHQLDVQHQPLNHDQGR